MRPFGAPKVSAAARGVETVLLLCAAATAVLLTSASAVYAAPTRTVIHDIGMYGDPIAAAPYWRQQHSPDCGEMAVADVVGQISGDEPTEQRITELAERTPSAARPGPILNLVAGTDIRDLPVLLPNQGRQHSDQHRRTEERSGRTAPGDRHPQRRNHLEPAWQPKRREPLRRRHRHRPQSGVSAPQR